MAGIRAEHAGPRIGGAGAGRDPALVLLARPARRRAPTAVVWQLVTYDRHTRTPVADIARRWQPVGTGPNFGDGHDGTVPEPVHRWLTAVLGPATTITGPAHDLAGPASWHISSHGGSSAGGSSAEGSSAEGSSAEGSSAVPGSRTRGQVPR